MTAPKTGFSTEAAQSKADIAVARRVLSLEAEALGALASSVSASFSAAVDLILKAKGRVIVSGMGKSGHVARKLAATLASTGTPGCWTLDVGPPPLATCDTSDSSRACVAP